jgi:hypothetical protein
MSKNDNNNVYIVIFVICVILYIIYNKKDYDDDTISEDNNVETFNNTETPGLNILKNLNVSGLSTFGKINLNNSEWETEHKGNDKSYIVSDNKNYKALMFVGHNQADGGARRIQMWDDVAIMGNTTAGGNLTVNKTFRANKINISNSEWEKEHEGNDKSYIVSDNKNYKALMIVGHNQADGGGRRIQMWDDVSIMGNTTAGGNLTVNKTFRANKINISNSEWEKEHEGNDKSYIVSDNKNYKTLMIVGHNQADGGTRKIRMWDDVTVDRNLTVNKTLYASKINLNNFEWEYAYEGNDKSYIVSDTKNYKALMIVGHNLSDGKTRKIQLYDDVNITNNLLVQGSLHVHRDTAIEKTLYAKKINLENSKWNDAHEGSNKSYIVSDTTSEYNALMIAGHNLVDGGKRRINMYDNVTIMGNATIGETLRANKINIHNSEWEKEHDGSDKSYIVSDNKNYKALMIVGHNQAGGPRKIQLYDDVTITNDTLIQGHLRVNKILTNNEIKMNDTILQHGGDNWIRLLKETSKKPDGTYNMTGNDYGAGLAAKNLWCAEGALFAGDIILKYKPLLNNFLEFGDLNVMTFPEVMPFTMSSNNGLVTNENQAFKFVTGGIYKLTVYFSLSTFSNERYSIFKLIDENGYDLHIFGMDGTGSTNLTIITYGTDKNNLKRGIKIPAISSRISLGGNSYETDESLGESTYSINITFFAKHENTFRVRMYMDGSMFKAASNDILKHRTTLKWGRFIIQKLAT